MGVLRDNWVKQMTFAMQMSNPDMDVKEIEREVKRVFDERFTDHEAQLYNNYENVVAKVSLNQMVDWFQRAKPLIAESGVFFHQKAEKRNVNVEIIKEKMLDARKLYKKEMFQAISRGDMFEADVKNRQQLNSKKAANSGYGAEGQSSSFLYNIHSAMSVTACGRGQISTACQCFENFIEDNVLFFNMNEFFVYVYNIVSEASQWKFDTFKIVRKVPSREKFIERFRKKFGHPTLCNVDMIGSMYDQLNDELRIRVYYKANLREFFLLRKPYEIYSDILAIDADFIDPNDVPKEMEEPVRVLTDIVVEFVGYIYSVFRYEDRTRYQKRKATIVIDTDSNFIYYGDLLSYLLTILPTRMFRNTAAKEMFELRVLNVLSVFVTRLITDTLFHYLDVVNVPEEERKHVNMKNELFYSTVFVTYAKKSYLGLLKRREALILPKPKIDVKGVNFFKSTASADTSQFIYSDILMDEILNPKDGNISLHRIYRKIYNFQNRITDEIASGNMGYLKRSIKVKTADAYAAPLRIGQYKAVYVWNEIVEDSERIELPATVTLIKVKLRKIQDVAPLAQWPKIYDKVMELFKTNEEIATKGINTIALPETYETIPDWVLSVIDVETLVSNNMSLFTQLYKPLGLCRGDVSHNSKTMQYYTNIVRI